MLQIENLNKSFGKTKVLKNIHLHVEKGEIVALLGSSGCGKTTLLRTIAGLETEAQGKITLNHVVVLDEKIYISPQKRKIGMVFQDYAIFPHLSVFENVAFGVRIDAKKIANEFIELVGLKGLEKRYPHELSGGQQQRVALARALAPMPRLLLLDEPFSNLDEQLKEKMRLEVVQIIRYSNTTAIFVTHDINDALSVTDKVAVMNEGKIEQFDKPEIIYHQPKTLHTASFMGKMNWISPENVFFQTVAQKYNLPIIIGEKFGFRPEYVIKCADGKFEGKVTASLFLGNAFLVYFEVGDWTGQFYAHENMSKGTFFNFEFDISHLIRVKA